MDKNSLILEIKNDINSIKKQVEVTLAKLDVLEALIKLEKVNGTEELGVKEELKPEPEPIVESVVEPESELVVEKGSELEPEVVVEQGAETEQVIELEIEEKVEEKEIIEEEITPHSSLLTPHCEEVLPLRNLMSVIGLNDRFRFRHDLFSNSDDIFRETIEILNTIESFEKAVDFLSEKFAWDEEDATVVYFYDIIKPKF